jgi:hypothetical protein
MVGVLFREREWEWDGKSGVTTECCTFSTVDDIRNGNFKMPKPKLLNKTDVQTINDFKAVLLALYGARRKTWHLLRPQVHVFQMRYDDFLAGVIKSHIRDSVPALREKCKFLLKDF